jgi:hypothetical protein
MLAITLTHPQMDDEGLRLASVWGKCVGLVCDKCVTAPSPPRNVVSLFPATFRWRETS